eukprot:1155443-Pelagomonas_calceolata.AAC.9
MFRRKEKKSLRRPKAACINGLEGPVIDTQCRRPPRYNSRAGGRHQGDPRRCRDAALAHCTPEWVIPSYLGVATAYPYQNETYNLPTPHSHPQ